MRAITIEPGRPDSAALEEMPEPAPDEGALLVDGVALGICGTDAEIVDGDYGWAPPGSGAADPRPRVARPGAARRRRAAASPPATWSSASSAGPTRCRARRARTGEWDFCRNGQYTERGIKELDGYGSRALADRARLRRQARSRRSADLGVLLEPTTRRRQGVGPDRADRRARVVRRRERVLVTGAGPIGLLAALMGVQRGLEVHVLDRVDRRARSRSSSRDLGATYHTGRRDGRSSRAPDIVIEAPARPAGRLDAMAAHRARRHRLPDRHLVGRRAGSQLDAGALNRTLVLENDVVFGSVNANRRHYEPAAEALAAADRAWLERLITRRVPLDRWRDALRRGPRRHQGRRRAGLRLASRERAPVRGRRHAHDRAK